MGAKKTGTGDKKTELTVIVNRQFAETDDAVKSAGFYAAIRDWVKMASQYGLEHPEKNLTPAPSLKGRGEEVCYAS